MLAVSVPVPGAAGPRTTPLYARAAAALASASTAADTVVGVVVEDVIDEDVIDGVDEPGVALELGAVGPAAGVVVIGSPLPGVRLVVQPNAARESVSVMAAT